MADEDDGSAKYCFVTENGEKKNTSRGQTGRGLATYTNEDVYEGDFLDGTREGRGKYLYKSNGDKYEGDWKSNCKHGLGRLIYAGKGEYYGYWENGRRHGEGVFTYPNGDTYSGWFKFGDKEGTGTYKFAKSQMKLFGEWKMGQICTGRWIYPNGVYYEGKFENNKPLGQGKWVFKSGNELYGEYEQKKKGEGEDEEEEVAEEDLEDGAVPKPKFKLIWHSHTGISEAAHMVNSVEQ